MRRKLLVAAAVLVVILGALVTRAVWEGRSALGAGDAAAARGDAAAAIDHWRRAARWYVPLAPHVGAAYARLARAAEAAEAAGDPATALAAWRAVRTSAIATRWLVAPFDDRRAHADRRIAALIAAQPVAGAELPEGADPTFRAAPDAGDTPAAREAFYLRQLGAAADAAPSRPWTLVALAGLALWIGGCVHFSRRALDAEDRFVRRAAASSGVLILAGMVVWVVGLYAA